MSSVTFLASAVLTVCILHAVDQNMEDAVQRMGNNIQEKAELNQSDSIQFKQVVKPEDAQVFTPSAHVFGTKKIESVVPNPAVEKQVVAKTSNAI